MIIKVYSNKYKNVEVFIDDEDYNLIKDYKIWVWGSSRHRSLYAFIYINKRSLRLHRYLAGISDNANLVVDHINGNALDNRRCNLRVTSQSNNNKNARKRHSARTSKYKGVHYDSASKKWKAQIQVNKRKIALGTFNDEISAAEAYNKAAKQYFNNFAVLNQLDASPIITDKNLAEAK